MTIRVSLQGQVRSAAQWLSLATSAEGARFDTLYAADHPGTAAAPFVALAAAAGVTDRIRLGTCVLNAGLWEPYALASEIATLDVCSDGRALLGVGAGHTPTEWTSIGREMPAAGARVARLREVVDAVRSLLAGEAVSTRGQHIELRDASLHEPRPVQEPIPLLVGGNGRRVLTFAAQRADIVGVSGLGETPADGHSHAADWRPEALERTFELVRDAASGSGRSPEVEALVQHVQVTDDPEPIAATIAKRIPGASPSDVVTSPFVWIGAPNQIVGRLRDFEQRWGVTRYVVREPAFDAAAGIIRMLHDTT